MQAWGFWEREAGGTRAGRKAQSRWNWRAEPLGLEVAAPFALSLVAEARKLTHTIPPPQHFNRGRPQQSLQRRCGPLRAMNCSALREQGGPWAIGGRCLYVPLHTF